MKNKADQLNELLTRRVEKIYPSKKALEKVLNSGQKLKLYIGIDPTSTKLHLGHTVGLRKLMEFSRLGHQAIFLFGTGTVLVGDPSLRDEGRKLISQEQVEENIKSWKKQTAPIIDFNQVAIRRNDRWLTKLKLEDLIKIGSKISALKLFKRKSFSRRINKGDTVWYHETMYPLLQGYDSVAMNIDLEIGGTDQTFNMLIGRELQKKFNHKEKFVLTVRMVNGLDGRPMSKTRGNCIWLTDQPKDIYGKVMGIVDRQIPDYFEFFTSVPMARVKKLKDRLKNQDFNPLDLKKELALEITQQFHGQTEAEKAQKHFEAVFQKGQLPKKMPVVKLKNKDKVDLVDLLVKTKLVNSKSQAKRLIRQKAVKVNREPTTEQETSLNRGDILQVGKRRFLKIA